MIPDGSVPAGLRTRRSIGIPVFGTPGPSEPRTLQAPGRRDYRVFGSSAMSRASKGAGSRSAMW